MSAHPLRQLIEAADRAISAGNFDGVVEFYADDAKLVVQPGLVATGKAQILKAFLAISDHFQHRLSVTQGKMEVVETGDTALVLMETILDSADAFGEPVSTTRRGTYVFRKSADETWLCVVDNSYGTDLLGR